MADKRRFAVHINAGMFKDGVRVSLHEDEFDIEASDLLDARIKALSICVAAYSAAPHGVVPDSFTVNLGVAEVK